MSVPHSVIPRKWLDHFGLSMRTGFAYGQRLTLFFTESWPVAQARFLLVRLSGYSALTFASTCCASAL
jgi:hypothetical protein